MQRLVYTISLIIMGLLLLALANGCNEGAPPPPPPLPTITPGPNPTISPTAGPTASPGWSYLGGAGQASETMSYSTNPPAIALYVDQGIPYLVYTIPTGGGKVKKFNGSSWDTLDAASLNTFYGNGLLLHPSLKIHNGIPYVTFGNGTYAKVLYFNAGTQKWLQLGPDLEAVTAPFSCGSMDFIQDDLYLAYIKWGGPNDRKMAVRKYNSTGNTWDWMGTYFGGTAYWITMAIDQNSPDPAHPYIYVAKSDDYPNCMGTQATFYIYNYTSTLWHDYPPGAPSRFISLAVVNGTPVFGYQDTTGAHPDAIVQQYNAGWQSIPSGSTGFGTDVDRIAFATAGGKYFMAFREWSNNYRLKVMKYRSATQQWTPLGTVPDVSIDDLAIFVAGNVPYVAFRNMTDSRISVIKYE